MQTTSNITQEVVVNNCRDKNKKNIITNKKSINGRELFRHNTIYIFNTTDETCDTDITEQQNEKYHKDKNKSRNSLENLQPSFNVTDVNALRVSQHLAPD